MESSLISLFLINCLLCGLLTLHLLARPIKNEHTRILGACYGLIALLNGLGYLSQTSDLWQFGSLRAVGAAFMGPLYYQYFQSILGARNESALINGAHLIPGVAIAIILFGGINQMMGWITPIILLSFWAYLVASVYSLVQAARSLIQANKAQPMAYQWLKVLVAILATNAISELLISWELGAGKPLAKSTFMYITAFLFLGINLVTIYFALQRHPLWDWMLEHTQHDKPLKNKGGDSSEATNRLLKQFMQQLNSQQWFKEETGFTIAMAARALNIPQRQLSEAINAETGLSYSQLMNKRRVEEAAKIMNEHPDKPLTAIMYDAGFRTKSSFNREFSRVMGKSPSEYQQQKHSIQQQKHSIQ